MTYTGKYYQHKTPLTEIAKKIRLFISDKIAEGTFPRGLKFSVRVDRGGWTQSINCVLIAIPRGFEILDTSRCQLPASGRLEDFACHEKSPMLTRIFNALDKFDADYNFDHSDPQTDYFSHGHYFFTKIDYELEKHEREHIFNRLKKGLPATSPSPPPAPAKPSEKIPKPVVASASIAELITRANLGVNAAIVNLRAAWDKTTIATEKARIEQILQHLTLIKASLKKEKQALVRRSRHHQEKKQQRTKHKK